MSTMKKTPVLTEPYPLTCSVTQAAALAGLSRQHVRSLVEHGEIDAFKADPSNPQAKWHVYTDSLVQWVEHRRRVGA